MKTLEEENEMKVGDIVVNKKTNESYKVLFVGSDSVVVENVNILNKTIFWMKQFKSDFEVK